MRKLITGVVLLLIILTACGQSDQEEAVSLEVLDSKTLAEAGFPLETPITLSVFITSRNKVDDFVNNEYTKWLEAQTNVKLEFIVTPEAIADEKLRLMLSTGTYPDMIVSKRFVPQEQAYYGTQGIIVPLNNMIEDYGRYSKEAFADYPHAIDSYTMPDGNIYNLPQINECYHCKATQKMWVYQPWLDKLGLDLPETTEDFKRMLIAFRDQDPNGNGLQDEVPLSGAIQGWETDVEAFIMNAFVYNSTDVNGVRGLYLDDGIITASYVQDGWRQGLKYLQELRAENLLDPNSFIQDYEALRQLGENEEAMILGTAPGGSMTTFTQIGGKSQRWKDFVAIPPLLGPGGVRGTELSVHAAVPGISITDKCEYPEVAFMLADLFYSEEATFRNTIGRPGIEWEYAEEGALGFDGNQALWTELIPYNTQENNIGWSQLGPNFRPASWRLGREATEDQMLEIRLYEETRDKYAPYFPDESVPLPLITMTEEQSAILLTYSESIESFVEEKLAYFILNDADIDKEWPSYVAELEAMGLEAMLAVYQEAYDQQGKNHK